MAAQVQQAEERVGALEVGLAAQVQRAEESMSQIESRRLWVEGKWKGLMTGECQQLWHVQIEDSIAKLNADAERLYQRGRTAGERLQQVAEQLKQVAAGVNESTKTLLEKGKTLQRRLRGVEERPGVTERLESVERSVQVCVNSVRVLHSYAEANGSSDSDKDDT